MAHYASNLDASPAVAPSSIPLASTSQPRSQGSHLTLPDLRSTSPLPPSNTLPGGTTAEPIEIELASETHSQSSGSVTYSFPTTNPFKTGATQLASPITPAEQEDISEGELQRPAWAKEGLGSTDLSPLSATSGLGAVGHIGSRSASPLPPGAAPPARDAVPSRSGTQ